MSAFENAETFCPIDAADWRKWLKANHRKLDAVWLIFYKQTSGKRNLTWSDAVDEALCFGWIDSRARPLDEHRYLQFFSKRKPNSPWSRINKDKVKVLEAQKKIAAAGKKSIELAKENGMWNKLDAVEDMIIPPDVKKAFNKHKGSLKFFDSLSKSVRKLMLHWIHSAKREETRQRRIEELASHLSRGVKPRQF